MASKAGLGHGGQHRHTILVAFARAHQDLVRREIHVFDSESGAFQEPQFRAVEEHRHQSGHALQVAHEGGDLFAGQDDRSGEPYARSRGVWAWWVGSTRVRRNSPGTTRSRRRRGGPNRRERRWSSQRSMFRDPGARVCIRAKCVSSHRTASWPAAIRLGHSCVAGPQGSPSTVSQQTRRSPADRRMAESADPVDSGATAAVRRSEGRSLRCP